MTPLASVSTRTAWHFCTAVALPRHGPNAMRWTIAPNPASHMIHVHHNGLSPSGTLNLMDNHGRTVLTTPMTGHQATLPVTGIQAGNYSILYSDSKRSGVLVGNVIIER